MDLSALPMWAMAASHAGKVQELARHQELVAIPVHPVCRCLAIVRSPLGHRCGVCCSRSGRRLPRLSARGYLGTICTCPRSLATLGTSLRVPTHMEAPSPLACDACVWTGTSATSPACDLADLRSFFWVPNPSPSCPEFLMLCCCRRVMADVAFPAWSPLWRSSCPGCRHI